MHKHKSCWLALVASLMVLPASAHTQESTWAQKWATVGAQTRAEMQAVERCRYQIATCTPAIKRFIALVELVKSQTGRARLAKLNREINLTVAAQSDWRHWGVLDVWSPPLVTLKEGRGDCEDFAILKAAVLQAAGEQVRLAVVYNARLGELHAVAEAKLGVEWLVLDKPNLIRRRMSQISEYRLAAQLTPRRAVAWK